MTSTVVGACPSCESRSALLGRVGTHLERRGRELARLVALLELADRELEAAVKADASGPSKARRSPLSSPEHARQVEVEGLCRHDRRFPAGLNRVPAPPAMIHVAGGIERLEGLLREPTVALVGSRRPSDYGAQTARDLARGLAVAGITVVSGLAEGIATAALSAALERDGNVITVMPCGLDRCYPDSRRSVYESSLETGCAISELPLGTPTHTWAHLARARIVAGLADLVVVVEAGAEGAELSHARLAQQAGVPLAAVPGRVNSPISQGPHTLLREGATLIEGPEDVLQVLSGIGPPPRSQVRDPAPRDGELVGPLREVLRRVRAGQDTVGSLLRDGPEEAEVLIALAELELRGLLTRGEGGRYLPRRRARPAR